MILASVLSTGVLSCSVQAEGQDAALTLALQLSREKDHSASALEFRRLAMASKDANESASYFWMAGYEYWRGHDHVRAGDMLDSSEDASPEIAPQALLLRAENSFHAQAYDETLFYLDNLLSEMPESSMKSYAARRLAATHLQLADAKTAEAVLHGANPDHTRGLNTIHTYQAGKDKSPRVGGYLGMAPGLGYAYSHEYANALRSLILNGIFIYAMVDTADDGDWGAFTALTFFEVTWYSGSIYGGVDAAHRYNHQRRDMAIAGVMGAAQIEPDTGLLPTLSLRIDL